MTPWSVLSLLSTSGWSLIAGWLTKFINSQIESGRKNEHILLLSQVLHTAGTMNEPDRSCDSPNYILSLLYSSSNIILSAKCSLGEGNYS